MPLVTSRRLLNARSARLVDPLIPALFSAALPAAANGEAGLSTLSRASYHPQLLASPPPHQTGCGCAVCNREAQAVQGGMHICEQGCTCIRHQAGLAWGSNTSVRAYSAAAAAAGICAPGCTCSRHQAWGSRDTVRAYAAAATTSPKEGEEGIKTEGQKESGEKVEEGAEGENNDQEKEELNVEELLERLKNTETAAETTAAQVSQLTDSLKRSLAEMENLRMRTSREVENAKKFAIQSFLKNILDVADNLERAYGAVPADALSEEEGKALDAAKLRGLLKGMMGGVATTEKVFLQALKQEGVQQFNPEGEKFDPNYHSALFEMVDPSKEPGQIGQVTKRGYTLHDRVIRPAEVGVVRAEEN